MKLDSPTQNQLTLAEKLGIDVASDTFGVAAARLMDVVAEAIGHEPARPSTQRQREFAESLGRDLSASSKRVASAIIGETLFYRGQAALLQLQLEPGDRVIRIEQFQHEGQLETIEQEFVVSSIRPNGRVYFKGGRGHSAWPTQLRKVEG